MYKRISGQVNGRKANSSTRDLPTIFVAIFAVVAVFFGGCKKNPVVPPAPTQLTFKLAGGISAKYSLFLDNSSGPCATISNDSTFTVPVEAGLHRYSVVDQVTECISDTSEVDAKDATTTTVEIGSSQYATNWVKCPRTAVLLVMSESGARYQMYLDGKLIREYFQVGQADTVDVTPGTHYVVAKPVGCVSSLQKTLTIPQYGMATVTIARNNFNFSFSSPFSLVASQGTYDSYIRVTWGGVSAPQYVIERKTGSGSWSQIGTSTDAAYNDYGVTGLTEYVYRVKAVWSCGESGYSNSFVGFRKGVGFSDTRVSFNNSSRVMTFTTDTKVWGYQSKNMALVLWIVRKYCIGSACVWIVSNSGCSTNTPGNYLGYSQCINPGYVQTIYNDAGVNMPYDCFASQTGNYYAFFRLSAKCPISSFSDSYLGQSDVLTITWTSGVNGTEGSMDPHTELDASASADLADLKAALESGDRIFLPDGKTPLSQASFMTSTATNPDRAWAWPEDNASSLELDGQR